MRRIAIVALLLAPAVALADDPPTPTPTPTPDLANDCAAARKLGKVCVLSFENEVIEPPVEPPPPPPLVVLCRVYMNSLLRMRHDFHREIIESAEGL